MQSHDIQDNLNKVALNYQRYLSVLLSFLAVSSMLGHNLSSGGINKVGLSALLIIALFLIYCGFSYWVILMRRLEKEMSGNFLHCADGFILALAVSEMDYFPWTSILLMGLLQFNALSNGGRRQWTEVNMGVITGLMCGFFLLGNRTIILESNLIFSIVVFIIAFMSVSIYGVFSYNYQQRLINSNAYFRHESEANRSHAYKLSRYLPSPVSAMLQGENYQLKTERKHITVFFSDIVGFTELSEELEAETLAELLNSYLSEMSKIANHFNGTVDKFIGDSIMVLFGDHNSSGVKRDAVQCVSMAIAMIKRMRELQAQWSELGIKKPLEIRIGINSGYCTVGTFGTNKNLDYTALGAHVNLASRLETAGSPGKILISHETWALIKDIVLCRDKGQIKAKGFSHPIQVYEVVDHRKNLGANQEYLSENLDGFSMHLDIEKIKNYDKEKVIDTLENAAKKLRNKHI